jgi:diacylglycerol kinase family enzyme
VGRVDQIVKQSVIACIVNRRARSDAAAQLSDRVEELFRAHGVKAETIVIEDGSQLLPVARRCAQEGCGVVVAAGGDGTVSAVASAIVGTDAALGVLPLGTLNHFAKDMGIPLDLDAAVENIIHGVPKLVDVGEVNERIFVNNSSVGLYPAIVQHRSRHQRRGMSKWWAFAHAIYTVLRRMPHFHATVHADGVYDGRDRTPFIFVGNNPYLTNGLQIGERRHLDTGRLWVCRAPDADRLGLIWMAIRALFGRTAPGELKVNEAEELWVQTRKNRRIKVANDGEVFATRSPLHYRIRPKALRVLVPAQS